MLTGYWIDKGHIYETGGTYTRCWIDGKDIYSIDDGYLGWIENGHIHTRSGYTQCWIEDKFIYGPKENLPWV
jgi:hypothetical protein